MAATKTKVFHGEDIVSKDLKVKPIKVASLENPVSVDEFMTAAQKGDLKTVMEYVKNGGDVNAKGIMGYTALMLAIENNNLGIIKFLASQPSADLDMFNDKGFNALTIAVKNNDVDVARILLRYGADVNIRDPQTGFTPLMSAVQNSSLEMIDFLINHGANLNAVVKTEGGKSEFEGMPALMLAVYYPTRALAESSLFDFSANKAIDNAVPIVKLLLESGANVKIEDAGGNTAYDIAKGKYLERVGKNIFQKWLNRIDPVINILEKYGAE